MDEPLAAGLAELAWLTDEDVRMLSKSDVTSFHQPTDIDSPVNKTEVRSLVQEQAKRHCEIIGMVAQMSTSKSL